MTPSTSLASFASPYDQTQRLIRLHIGTDNRWDDVFLPQQAEGQESINDDYRFEVDCLCASTHVQLKSLLGLPATLTVHDQDGNPVVRNGVISSVKALGADGGFSRYAIGIIPPIALWKHRVTSRVFQDKSSLDILQQILNEHQTNNPVFARQQNVKLKLIHTPPSPRSYVLQYRESDYAFIERLLKEDGLCWTWQFDDAQNAPVTMVVFDDPNALPQATQARIRYHRADATEAEDSLTDWSAQRQVVPSGVSMASFDYKQVDTYQGTAQSSIEQGGTGKGAQSTLEDYDAQTLYYAPGAEELSDIASQRQAAYDAQAKTFSGAGTARGLMAGQWFRLDDHPVLEGTNATQKSFVVTTLNFHANNNLPDEVTREVPSSLLAADSTVAQPYRVNFDARRRGVPLTPVFSHTDHAKPTANGIQTATVVGPESETVYTDADGRIKIQFHWQRPQEHADIGANFDENSSCWVRVAMPSAGAGWGHQFIPRVGQEVLVDFIEGDIDRPVVKGVLYNGMHYPPNFSGAGSLPGNKTLSGIKSREHQGRGYNELLFDDTPNQVRAKLSSEHGKTQLNQGYLTQPRRSGQADPRGEGFELRTDNAGAIRAPHGLLLSTEAQGSAAGRHLARDGAQSQLDAALTLSQQLGQTATTQQAGSVETGPHQIGVDNSPGDKADSGHLRHLSDALKTWENGNNTAQNASGDAPGQQALLVLSAPGGTARVTEQSQTVAAGANLDLVAQRDTQQTSGRRWLHNVAQHISLFVKGAKRKASLKILAAMGTVQMQAQNGDIEVTSDQSVGITACNGTLSIVGAKEILLACGGGYVRIGGGDIDLHCPGTISVKGSSHQKAGATSLVQDKKLAGQKGDMKVRYEDADGNVPAGEPLKLHNADGTVIPLTLDGDGWGKLHNVDFDVFKSQQHQRLGE
jgi:type VI secretion system secreted protein VgrG